MNALCATISLKIATFHNLTYPSFLSELFIHIQSKIKKINFLYYFITIFQECQVFYILFIKVIKSSIQSSSARVF